MPDTAPQARQQNPEPPGPGQSTRRMHREQDGGKPVERRAVGDRGDVGAREAVRGGAGRARDDVAHQVERRPQDRAAQRREARTAGRPSVGLLEEGRVEPFAASHVLLVEIPVLVLERHVAIEPERAQWTEKYWISSDA